MKVFSFDWGNFLLYQTKLMHFSVLHWKAHVATVLSVIHHSSMIAHSLILYFEVKLYFLFFLICGMIWCPWERLLLDFSHSSQVLNRYWLCLVVRRWQTGILMREGSISFLTLILSHVKLEINASFMGLHVFRVTFLTTFACYYYIFVQNTVAFKIL